MRKIFDTSAFTSSTIMRPKPYVTAPVAGGRHADRHDLAMGNAKSILTQQRVVFFENELSRF
jgi:hypothetical protein